MKNLVVVRQLKDVEYIDIFNWTSRI